MANSIYIDVSQLIKAAQQLKGMEKELSEAVDQTLNANALEIATKAKTLAPTDMGGLKNSISADVSKPLSKTIAVNAFYAPFIEFGTGKYAAQYVGTLPNDWQAFAAKYKDQKGGGTAYEFWQNLIKWVSRKSRFKPGAVTGTHSTKTGRRTGNKRTQQAENEAAAYIIMLKILRNGIKGKPFLFPAYDQQRGQIEKDIAAVIKALTAI